MVPTSNHVQVGVSLPRPDGPDKITGRARYAGDQALPGLLYARLVLSPYAHARIRSIDTTPALNVPEVVAAFTAETLGMRQAEMPSRAQSPLAINEVLWSGHPVAIVVGETEASAEDGAAAVEVDYEPLPAVIDPESFAKVDPSLAQSSSQIPAITMGDIEAGLREADVVVECSYRTHPVHQSYMEPQSVTVASSASGHQLVIWPSTQGLFNVRSAVASALNLPERQIRVEPVTIGGGFGGKETLIEPLVASVVSRLRKPVRLAFSRQDDLLAGNPAPQTAITVKLGARRDGTLTAIQASMMLDVGAYPYPLAGFSGYHFSGSYRCPNIDIQCVVVQTNKPGTGAYRAPSGPQAYFAMESTVQELCEQLGMDPIRFRQINSLKEGDPNTRHGRWPRIGLLECLEEIQKHPLWKQREERKEDIPVELAGWKIGIGVAVGGWQGGTEPAAAMCRLDPDGTFNIVVGSIDLSGSDASLALIAAEELGLAAEAVSVTHDSTDSMPYSGLSAGSKTIYTVGAAVLKAAQDAREQVFTIAAEMLEASPEDMELRDGKVMIKGVPEKYVTLQQIAANSMRFGAPFEPVYGRGRSANRVSSPMFTAHLARVAVDPETGEVRVLDYVAAQDVGRAINPAEVEGQIHGGIVQGIGWALFEGMTYDEQGQLLTSTFMDYALPHSGDIPAITPILVEVPSALGPFGAKGVGEPPVVPVAAAIANAIKDAVGVRMRELPMTAERVYKAMRGDAAG